MNNDLLINISPFIGHGLKCIDKNNHICQITGWMGANPFYEIKDPECSLDCNIFKVMYLDGENKPEYDFADWGETQITPLLRPISDLSVACLDNGNIPLVLLAKTFSKFESYEIRKGVLYFDKEDGDEQYKQALSFSYNALHYYKKNVGLITYSEHSLPNHIELYNLLHKWFFDVYSLIDQGIAKNMNDYIKVKSNDK